MPEPEKSERSNALLAADAGAAVSSEQAKKDHGAGLAAGVNDTGSSPTETASRTEQMRVAIHASLNFKMRDAWIDALIAAVRVDAAERIKAAFGAHCIQCPQCQQVALEAAGLAAPSPSTGVSSSTAASPALKNSSAVRAEAAQEIERLRRSAAP